MTTYDVIIIGAGAMGSAAAYYAARDGRRVLLLEQFEIDHQRGSSYGYSRIIRYAYTDPVYIQLAKVTFPLWAALQAEAGETLYTKTGGIDFGLRGEPTFEDTMRSMSAEGIPYEVLDPAEAMRRFPQFRFDDDMSVLYQSDTGALAASKCVRAHVRLAERHGAVVKANTRVMGIDVGGDSAAVHTMGESFSAARLIITAGAWTRGLLETLGIDLPLTGQRCQEIYFEPTSNPDWFLPGKMPVFIHHKGFDDGTGIYGLPGIDGSGVKAARHGGDVFTHPAEVDYEPSMDVVEQVRAWTRRYLPAIGNGRLINTRVCLYTMTPDEHFIIDHHPEHKHVMIASPCSGHGFKFSTTIGSILNDLAFKGRTDHDIALFNIGRFLA